MINEGLEKANAELKKAFENSKRVCLIVDFRKHLIDAEKNLKLWEQREQAETGLVLVETVEGYSMILRMPPKHKGNLVTLVHFHLLAQEAIYRAYHRKIQDDKKFKGPFTFKPFLKIDIGKLDNTANFASGGT